MMMQDICSRMERTWRRVAMAGTGICCGVVLAGGFGYAEPDDAAGASGMPRTVPKLEHLAWCPGGSMRLDGPRLEAMTPDRPGAGLSDEAGNVFFGTRCLNRETGVITTIADDYWQTAFDVAEGPMSAFSSYEPYPADYATFCRFVSGSPLDGGEKGCIYFGDFQSGQVKKVWKNPDKGGRWWFRRIAGGGKTALPKSKGGIVPALEANLSGTMMLQVMPNGRLIVYAEGGFFEYREGNLVCLLGENDHKSGKPKSGVMGGDGTFYLGYYFGGGGKGVEPRSVLRVLPNGTVEPYIHGRFGSLHDGQGLHTGYFCGPHFWAYMHNYKFIPNDVLILCAHDEDYLRRARNGRVSTLCKDGQWRELKKEATQEGLRWFRWLRGNMCPAPGPNGTFVSPVGWLSTTLTFLVTGIDYERPAIGEPLAPPPPGASGEKGSSKETGKKQHEEE